MNIAIVGSGIAGLACAHALGRDGAHQVTLFEAGDYLGGHTNTVDVTQDGITYPVDTGFLVFNQRTYPNLIRLFAELGVPTAASEMSFSVSLGGELEWAGTSLSSLFAQPGNLLKPRFWAMLRDILRFNRAAIAAAGPLDRGGILGAAGAVSPARATDTVLSGAALSGPSGLSALSGLSLGAWLEQGRYKLE